MLYDFIKQFLNLFHLKLKVPKQMVNGLSVLGVLSTFKTY